jgi:nucleoside-diphosphate-sugar epimerase
LLHLAPELRVFKGEIVFDTSKPDGTPRKLMDSGRIRALGWKLEISFDDGIADAYRWFLETSTAGQERGLGAA